MAPQSPWMAVAAKYIFIGLLIYYWAMQFTRGDSVYLIDPEISYYMFVIPAAVFGVLGIFLILLTQSKLSTTSLILGLFCVLILVVSALRSDSRTIFSLGMLAINLIVFFQLRPKVSLDILNVLFALAMVITTILFYFEYSIYTFIPGLNAHPFHWWRGSVYPSAAEGGLFAMIIFLANLTMKGQRLRLPFILLSAYMLILAGNRTALFGALLGLGYMFLKGRGLFVSETGRRWFMALAIGAFLMSVFASQLLLSLPFADTAFVQDIILREEAVNPNFDEGGQVGTAAIRVWIMQQHLSIFMQNPLIGIGTFNFFDFNTGYGAIDNLTTGSEAFVTGLLARIGLLSALLLGALLATRQPGNQDFSICCRIGMTAGMITYGSFVNVYDIVFVLLVLGIAGCIVPSRSDTVSPAA
jgi:hypothetical protein